MTVREDEKEWVERARMEKGIEDPTEDHKRGMQAMQNPIRRQIVKLLHKGMSPDEMAREIDIDEQQVEYHLSMLEEALFVEQEGGRYMLTPRGEGYLKNVKQGL